MPGRRNRSSSSSDVEVIEDSEPERQERLAKLRLAKKQLQKGKDLAQDVDQVRTSQATTHTQLSVPPSARAESVVSSGTPPRQAKSSSLLVRKPAPPPWLASTTTNHTSPSKPIVLKSSSQPSPVKQMDLSSFAYQKRTIGRSTSYSASAHSVNGSNDKGKEIPSVESCSDAPQAFTKSPKASASPKVFILGATKECPDTEASFTPAQIASLTSCIVCGHAWTARKLPKHKWSHITSCARKGGCNQNTLYIKLIAAIVNASDVSDAKVKKSTKGKGKEKEKEPTGPQSLLAQAIQERALPKRRGRRVEPEPSVLQPVGDTHKVILERGAVLLGVAPAPDVESQPAVIPEPPEEEHEMKEQETEDEPTIPSTQTFAPSKIGGHSRLFGTTLATLNMDSRSGLFYADLPCTVLPSSTTRSFSTLESSLISSLSDPPVPLITPRSAPATLSSDSSVISISSSDDSESNPSDFDILDDDIHSPVFSDSSASIIILDSTRSYISRHEPASPSSPVNSHTSFHPASRRQSFGEEWNSQDGVYMWEEYNPSRPSSPTDLLADYIHELSLRENDAMPELTRGRSRSPRPLARAWSRSRSRSRSRRPSRSYKKGSKPSTKRSGRTRPKSPRSIRRSRSRSHASSKGKGKQRLKSKSKSPSRSKSRVFSPKPRKRRAARRGSIYAPEDGEDGLKKKDLDARLLDLILQDKELYLRILRYEPIKFEDILDMAVEDGIPKHGLPIKLKAFLDSQSINFYSAEALGRKKKRRA